MKSLFSLPGFAAFVLGFSFLTSSSIAQAGVWEIGASGSYRRQNIDVDAIDEAQSITGSVSYYLDDASALELSYTDGKSRRQVTTPSAFHKTTVNYRSVGLDFIYTIGKREAQIRPYFKVGAQYIITKQIVDQYTFNGTASAPSGGNENNSLVPSAGAGIRIGLTEALSLKAGIDAWSSRPLKDKPFDVDYAGRVGLGWMF
jgi:OprF membrane domain